MTDPYLPPPERDIPADQARRMRAAVLTASTTPAHRSRTRWPAAALVAAAVLAVIVGLTQPSLRTGPIVAEPTPARPVPSATDPTRNPTASPTPTPTPANPSADQAPIPTDRGALSVQTVKRTIAGCQRDLQRRSPVARVHFAQDTLIDGPTVLFTDRAGVSYQCTENGSGLYGGPGSRTRPEPTPSPKYPAVRLTGPGFAGSWSRTSGILTTTSNAAYLTAPDVARVELRVVVDGRHGPWYSAETHEGYAFVGAKYRGPAKLNGHRALLGGHVSTDDRAFDSAGRPVAIDRTAR